jgi:hypothetical protein
MSRYVPGHPYRDSRNQDWTVLSLPAIVENEQQIPVGDHEFYHRDQAFSALSVTSGSQRESDSVRA